MKASVGFDIMLVYELIYFSFLETTRYSIRYILHLILSVLESICIEDNYRGPLLFIGEPLSEDESSHPSNSV